MYTTKTHANKEIVDAIIVSYMPRILGSRTRICIIFMADCGQIHTETSLSDVTGALLDIRREMKVCQTRNAERQRLPQ
jgi:hypothetical protein